MWVIKTAGFRKNDNKKKQRKINLTSAKLTLKELSILTATHHPFGSAKLTYKII